MTTSVHPRSREQLAVICSGFSKAGPDGYFGHPDVGGSVGHGEDDLVARGNDTTTASPDVGQAAAWRMEVLDCERIAFGFFCGRLEVLRP